jgi:opacity protein-like surface antigen
MLALSGAIYAAAVAAEPAGYYVGGGFGAMGSDIDTGSLAGAIETPAGEPVGPLSAITSDRSDLTYDALVGYRFSTRYAIELQYLWLGDVSMHAEAGRQDGGVDARWRLKGPSVSAIAGWPISPRWDVYMRAGAMFAETDATIVYAASGDEPQRIKARETTTELVWGAGFAYNATPQWTVRLEYQQVPNAGDPGRTGELDVERITLGWVCHY